MPMMPKLWITHCHGHDPHPLFDIAGCGCPGSWRQRGFIGPQDPSGSLEDEVWGDGEVNTQIICLRPMPGYSEPDLPFHCLPPPPLKGVRGPSSSGR